MKNYILTKATKLHEWNEVKITLHRNSNSEKPFREGEVRWIACGENVGTEINGKGKIYARPVFILRKLDTRSFIGIPLTTQKKEGSWYVKLNFQEREIRAVISQIRIYSTKRMYNRIGKLDERDVDEVKKALRKLLDL